MKLKTLKLTVFALCVICTASFCKKTTEEVSYANSTNTLLGTKGKIFGEAQHYLETGYLKNQ